MFLNSSPLIIVMSEPVSIIPVTGTPSISTSTCLDLEVESLDLIVGTCVGWSAGNKNLEILVKA